MHCDLAGARVLGHVGQGFLRDAKEHRFILGWQAFDRTLHIQEGAHVVATLKLLDIPIQRGFQPHVVQQRRPQVGDDLAQLANGIGAEVLQLTNLRQQRRGDGRARGQDRFYAAQAERNGRQRLAGGVVQFTGHALAFRFLGVDHLVQSLQTGLIGFGQPQTALQLEGLQCAHHEERPQRRHHPAEELHRNAKPA